MTCPSGHAGAAVEVQVPPTRSDVLHPCDIAEDVAVAYGFNNVPEALPAAALMGRELPLNQLTELLRVDVAAAGFTEILTWALCSRFENFGALQHPEGEAVEIGNPATQEFQVCDSAKSASLACESSL
jgi:phenylalanyl-tRNA synthetase beta chain